MIETTQSSPRPTTTTTTTKRRARRLATRLWLNHSHGRGYEGANMHGPRWWDCEEAMEWLLANGQPAAEELLWKELQGWYGNGNYIPLAAPYVPATQNTAMVVACAAVQWGRGGGRRAMRALSAAGYELRRQEGENYDWLSAGQWFVMAVEETARALREDTPLPATPAELRALAKRLAKAACHARFDN